MSVFRRLLALTVVTAVACRETTALAGDDDSLQELLSESVVSGASKSAEVASDAPATTTNITAEEMRRFGIRSLDEAINFLGMGLVTQNPLHSVEVGGRGVLITSDFGNHVLLVVDGHVMNEPWNGTAYFEQGAAIPIDLIDHVELILGPGSVLYGGSAMFGVVNVVTKRAAVMHGFKLVGEVSASPEQGRNGSLTNFAPSHLGSAQRGFVGFGHELTLFGRTASFVGGAELYHQDGPSFELGPQSVTNEDGSPKNFGPRSAAPGVWGGRVRDQYKTSVPTVFARATLGDLTAMARVSSYKRATPYPNWFNQFVSDFDDGRNFEQDRWISLDVQHRARFGRLSTFVRPYADFYWYRQYSPSSDGSVCAVALDGPCVFSVLGRSQWAGAEVQGAYDWLGDERLTTMVGADTRVRYLGAQTDTLDGAENFYGTIGKKYVTEVTTSVYGQQRWRPISRLHLNGGARFDTDPRGGNRVSPRAAIAFDAWRGGTLKAIYSEAFRAPSFYESFYEAPDQRAPATIRSEVVKSLEASFEQKLGRHRLVMGVFRTHWSDMISLREVEGEDGLLEFRNAATIENYGYNARVEGALGELRYGASATGAHTNRFLVDREEHLPAAPQLYGNARVSYALPGSLPTVAIATSLMGARSADRALDGQFQPVPYAPTTLDLRVILSDRLTRLPGLSYRVALDWITASRSPYVVGPVQDALTSATPNPRAELAPINRATAFITLQYEIDP